MDSEQHGMKKKKDYLLPGSILFAAILISVALIYNAGKSPDAPSKLDELASQNVENPLISLSEVTKEDHILGDLDAPIKIVLFSDTECPFCKNFHFAMQRVMAEYGDDVAWVYRHVPIDALHPKARTEAEATECAAELGGNETFWAYLDRLMEITPSNNGLDLSKLPQIATYVGLDENEFSACLASGRHRDAVQADLDESVKLGIQGTPYSIVIINNQPKYAIPGAVPFNEEVSGQPYMKMIVEELLKEI